MLDEGSAIRVIVKNGMGFCPSNRFIKSDYESLRRLHQEYQKENKLSRFAELECRASSIKEFQKVLERTGDTGNSLLSGIESRFIGDDTGCVLSEQLPLWEVIVYAG